MAETKPKFVDALAEAIKREEGYYVTELQAQVRKIPWPTVAQRLKNPGNIREWKGYVGGKLVPYPRKKVQDGWYVDFADPIFEDMPYEGERVLRVLIQQYIDGKYTKGKSPTLMEMFAVYAPAADKNRPMEYARNVGKRLSVPIGTPLKRIQEEWDSALPSQ